MSAVGVKARATLKTENLMPWQIASESLETPMASVAAEIANPERSVRPSSTTPLCRMRKASGYEMAVRVVGASWFLILALVEALKVIVLIKAASSNDFGPPECAMLLSGICLFLFDLMLCWLTLHRPSPVARTTTIMPSFIAFIGTYLPWSVVLIAPAASSTGQNLASAALLFIGAVLMVVVISRLGRCFSIVPQARGVVRTGPYAIVRHPLYLVEEIALLGVLLQAYSPVTLALFLAHGALQIRRIFYEEQLLRQTFADYDLYAKTTSRLIPYVW